MTVSETKKVTRANREEAFKAAYDGSYYTITG